MSTQIHPDINMEELFAVNSPTRKALRHHARKLVKQKVFAEDELEDVEQELTVRLLRRLQSFEPDRASLATFVDRAVRFEAMEIFRTRCKPTHVRERKTRSLDAITVQRDGMSLPLSEAVTREEQVRGYGRTVQDDLNQVDLRQDLSQAIAALPEDLQDVCGNLMDERNPLQAIRRLPTETRERLLRHFETSGLADYV